MADRTLPAERPFADSTPPGQPVGDTIWLIEACGAKRDLEAIPATPEAARAYLAAAFQEQQRGDNTKNAERVGRAAGQRAGWLYGMVS